ncbi:CpaF family protein [Bacillus sp. RO1]|uniref:CpaF family protein n=1 Tax=Bacillus sp. RO1 TaxID=2722703 RepID=UPI0032166921
MSLLRRLGVETDVVEGSKGLKVSTNTLTNTKTVYLPQFKEIEMQLHNYLVDKLKQQSLEDRELEGKVAELSDEFFVNRDDILNYEEKQAVIQNVIYELTGYGPITPLLNDSAVTEVMVNGPTKIYVEKQGKIIKTPFTFRDNSHVLKVMERIVAPIGRRIDESVPMVDARLPDGSRVHAIIPPLAMNGPTLTIRKFPDNPLTIHDLLRNEGLSYEMADFLKSCVEAKLNMMISGGTGSGKTTCLNVLSSFITEDERIVTIEDSAELRLSQEHVITLEARLANVEGKGEVTIRDLVKNALRMRPDRIIVGEVRSAEALDMLQAMNTGHDGSLGTGHANSPRDLISRLEVMVMMAGFDLPVRAIREQIAGALDLIVHQVRLKDGSRKITHITEVLGVMNETIVLQDLFKFEELGKSDNGRVKGRFSSTGIRPSFFEKFEVQGIKIQPSWFSEE